MSLANIVMSELVLRPKSIYLNIILSTDFPPKIVYNFNVNRLSSTDFL